MRLEGKVILITGGSAGQGKATALKAAAEGAKIGIGSRNEENGQAVVEQIVENGGEAIFQQTDVTKADQVLALVERAEYEFGQLDGAFNSAGIQARLAPIHRHNLEESQKVVETNFMGVFYSMMYEGKSMSKRKSGSIVNASAIIGVQGFPGRAVYCGTKAGVTGMTKCAALDYANMGVRVNAIAQGPVRTPMLDGETNGQPDKIKRYVPMNRIAEPDEIAELVIWLLSDASSYVTGQTIGIDGGMSAG